MLNRYVISPYFQAHVAVARFADNRRDMPLAGFLR